LQREASAVVLWTGSAAARRRLTELGVRSANSDPGVARRLENKAHFQDAARVRGIPVPRSVSGVAGPALLAAASHFGRAVFQLARGYSGAATFPVQDASELGELLTRFEGHPCRVAEFVEGTPVTVTGVALEERVALGPPCLQLTGLAELTPHPLGSCGNDFSSPVPGAEAVAEVAQRTGEWLQELGHRGIFGVDLVVDPKGRPWCIEVNPRLVASVPLWSLSAPPGSSLLDLHLAAFGLAEDTDAALYCRWSQLILYQRGRAGSAEAPVSEEGAWDSGGGFVPDGRLTLDGPGPGRVGLIRRSPAGPGKELARLILEGPLIGADGDLLPHLRAAVLALRAELEPEPAHQ
ncbi:MAG: ATP-grasp domain-containing protein, partial [Candidatus Dormibacteria bacterium]